MYSVCVWGGGGEWGFSHLVPTPVQFRHGEFTHHDIHYYFNINMLIIIKIILRCE